MDHLQNILMCRCKNVAAGRTTRVKVITALFAGSTTMCVLVVEDDETIGKVIMRNLSKYGFFSKLATNGQQAKSDFTQYDYNLVLMDLGLPDMDGLETTRMIRKLERDENPVPIIAITAGHSSNEECLQAGMNDYYIKPVLEKQLRFIIEKWWKGNC